MVKATLEEIKFEKNIGKLENTLFKIENNIKSAESGIKVKKKYFIILFNSLSLNFFINMNFIF